MKIDEKLRRAISECLSQDIRIKLIYLFGSAAREAADYRDIDLAVLISAKDSDQERDMEIAESFKKSLLGTFDPGVPIQITPLNSANPLLRFEAIKEGKCLYSLSEEERISFELKTLREYGDYKAKSRFYEQALKERLKRKLA